MKNYMNSKSGFVRAGAVAGVATAYALAFSASAFATDGVWTNPDGGAWSSPANWANGEIANGVGAKAVVETDGKGGNIYLADRTYTLGTLVLKSRTQWNLQKGTIVLDAGGSTAPTISVSKTSGWDNQFLSSTLTLQGQSGFVKRGNGKLYIAGNNTYTGVTTVNEGILEVGSANALGATGQGNGTVVNHTGGNYPLLRLVKNVTTDEEITIRQFAGGANDSNLTGLLSGADLGSTLNSPLRINRSGNSTGAYDYRVRAEKGSRLVLAGGVTGVATDGARNGLTILQLNTAEESASIRITGPVVDGSVSRTGGLSLRKTGPGAVELAAASTYTGGTLVEAGPLLVSNREGSATGAGNLLVKSGAVLAGTGVIAPSGNSVVSFESGSAVAPGSMSATGGSIGSGEAIHFNLKQTSGKVIFAAGAKVRVDISVGSGADSLAFTGLSADGQVEFNGNVIDFAIYGPERLPDGVYTLVSFDRAGAYSGELALGEGLKGNQGKLVYHADRIELQIGGTL